jgi:cyclic pyranopterin phosphate synthase
MTDANEELGLDELMLVAAECARHGIKAIKLTGGDPALWSPLVMAVRRLKAEGFTDVHVISRHPKIGNLANALAEARVDLLNISIDTLKPELHRQITGVNDLPAVLNAVSQCAASGVPTKVNMVVMGGINDDEVETVAATLASWGVRELKLLDVIQDLDLGNESFSQRLSKLRGKPLKDLYVPLEQIVQNMRPHAISEKVIHQGDLGHPMLSMQLMSGLRITVKSQMTGAWYGSICNACPHYACHDALMALRLTADMRLQFCLLREDVAVDLRPVLARGADALKVTISDALSVFHHAVFKPAQQQPLARDIPTVLTS